MHKLLHIQADSQVALLKACSATYAQKYLILVLFCGEHPVQVVFDLQPNRFNDSLKLQQPQKMWLTIYPQLWLSHYTSGRGRNLDS